MHVKTENTKILKQDFLRECAFERIKFKPIFLWKYI